MSGKRRIVCAMINLSDDSKDVLIYDDSKKSVSSIWSF